MQRKCCLPRTARAPGKQLVTREKPDPPHVSLLTPGAEALRPPHFPGEESGQRSQDAPRPSRPSLWHKDLQGRLGSSWFTCFGSLPLSLSFSLSLILSLSLSLLFSFSFLGNNKCELAVAEILLSEVDFPAVEKETCEKESKFAMLMSDCSSEIKSRLLLGRKAMTNIDSILKSRDITC